MTTLQQLTNQREILFLFVWSRSAKWSATLAETLAARDINQSSTKSQNMALRTICADSIEARSILANTTPRIIGVPALIAIEHQSGTKEAEKKMEVLYNHREIAMVLTLLAKI